MKRARWISRCGVLAAVACMAGGCTRESGAQDARGEAHASAAGVAVYAPRIVEPAADVAALYFVVVDHAGLGDRLLGVQSSVGEAMLHESLDEQGVARMRRALAGFAVPAHGELRLEPGGPHVMLVGLREPLAIGQRIRVTLEFERVGHLSLEVPVVAADGEALALGTPAGESRGDDANARTP
jgi:copper(I)-binding protein